MKIDTLNFMTVLLNSHSPQVVQPHLGTIIPAVITAVDDSFYRITSEALLVLNCIVKTMRPCESCLCDIDVVGRGGGWVDNIIAGTREELVKRMCVKVHK